MTVSLIVPLRPDGAERDRNWAYVRARYERLYPDWEIVCHPGNPTGPWSKGTAVNAAAQMASGDVVVVADADLIVAADVLPHAVSLLDDAPWVMPHRMVYRLTEKASKVLIAAQSEPDLGPPARAELRRGPHVGPPGGGIVVARHDDFETVGGIDPGFTEWGGEDISFARALDTLIGEHTRLDANARHLSHKPMRRRPGNRASPDNEKLAGRYLDASGRPGAMAALCERTPYEGTFGGGFVIAPREVIRSIPPDPRFLGWGRQARKTEAGDTRSPA